MSPLEQVLAAAKNLTESGKTPSLALLKTKLGTSISMPILIQGLQQFKSMPKCEIKDIPELKLTATLTTDTPSEIQQLKQEMRQLKAEYQTLLSRMDEIEKSHLGAKK